MDAINQNNNDINNQNNNDTNNQNNNDTNNQNNNDTNNQKKDENIIQIKEDTINQNNNDTINQNKEEKNNIQINEDTKKTNDNTNNKKNEETINKTNKENIEQNNKETITETNNENIGQNIEDITTSINEDVKKDYSYECLNIINLSSYIYEGVNETKVDIILKNNGNKEWPKNTKLSFQQKSEIKGNDLLLDSQSPGQQKQYSFYFKNIGDYSPKEYKLFYLFNLNGENLGEEIIVKINIKQKKQTNNELNEYSDQIKEFRDTYGIGNDIEDEKILRVFKETNFNYEASFDKLFE